MIPKECKRLAEVDFPIAADAAVNDVTALMFRCRALLRTLLVAALCTAAFYAAAAEEPARTIHICRKRLLSWKGPPDLKSPQDVAQHLSKNRDTSVKWIYRYTVAVLVTPFKQIGLLGGWTDYCTEVCATGLVVEAVSGTDGFRTVDLKLHSLLVNGEDVPLDGPRFLRAEIYGQARKTVKYLPRKGDLVQICGKLMWDGDGWLEVHPRTPKDVSCRKQAFTAQKDVYGQCRIGLPVSNRSMRQPSRVR